MRASRSGGVRLSLFLMERHASSSTALMYISGPEPAILDCYGHCVRLSVDKLGGSGGILPHEIRHSEIAAEAMFGPKCY